MKHFLLVLAFTFTIVCGFAQNVGIGTNDPKTKLDLNGGLSLREGPVLTLANGGASGGVNDNISLPDISGSTGVKAAFYRIAGPTAAFSVYGIQPATGADGQMVTLVNTTSNVMTIKNNASSVAVNGFKTLTGSDMVSVAGNSSITIQYNKTDSRWYVTGTQNYQVTAGSLATGDITTSNNAINLTNNTNRLIGTPAMTIDVQTNALNQKGLVPGPTGGNPTQVWGTDGSGNPAWQKVNNNMLINNSVTINPGTGMSGGGAVALGGSITLTNSGDTNPADDITTSTTAGGDLSGTYPNPGVAKIKGTPVSATAPTNGQVLKYNSGNGQWEPAADNNAGGTVTSVATGTGLTGGPITTTGTISLANTAVTPGSYTNTNITVDAQGRITAATNGTNGTVTGVTASNGLTSSGGATPNITLGGTLTGATTIANAGFNLNVTGTGNVGIGTASPATKLDVTASGAINTTTPGQVLYNLHLSPATLTADHATGLTFGSTSAAGVPQAGIYVQSSGSYGTKMYFATTDAYVTGSKTRMMIDHLGNVGIGVTAMSVKLKVAGDIESDNQIRAKGWLVGTGTGQALEIGVAGSNSYVLGYDRTAGAYTPVRVAGSTIDLRHSDASSDVFINTSGNVGVNTNSPLSKLDVNGGTAIGSYAANNAAPTNGLIVSGNMGVGTPSPGKKLQVNGGSATVTSILTDGHVEDISGIMDGNFVPSRTWTVSSGSVGIFADNGGAGDNVREWGDGPQGNRVLLWKCQGSGGDADGGWNTSTFPIDNTKTYRVSVWVKRTSTSGGTTYFGVADDNLTLLNGGSGANPYFYASSLPVANRWYLMVGYIHSKDDASTATSGGIYDGTTGQKVISFSGASNGDAEFKFTSSSTVQQQRAYLYYNSLGGLNQWFWDPKFEEVNGKETPISSLVGVNSPASGSGSYIQNQTASAQSAGFNISGAAYVGGSMGIGTTSPVSKLNVNGGDVQVESGMGRFKGWYNAGSGLAAEIGVSSSQAYLISYDRTASAYSPINLSGSTVALGHSGVTDLFVTTGGNVGIGTTAPGYKLQVNGDIYANGGWMRVSGTQGLYFESYGGGFYMQDGTWIRGYGSKSLWMGSGLIGGDGGLTIGYGGTGPNTTAGAIIAGRVGVGTSAPASVLHAAGVISTGIPSGGMGGASANTGAVLFYNPSNGNTVTLQSGTTSSSYTLTLPTAQGGAQQILVNDGSGNLAWGTNTHPWENMGNDVRQICNGGSAATDYEWGVTYNNSSPILRVTCNGWNTGSRVCTYPPYPTGDSEPFTWGGACWIWNTNSAWDDGCSTAYHSYYTQDANGRYNMVGGNGCGSLPTVYRRKL